MKELAFLNKYFYKYKFRFLGGVVFVAAANVMKVLSPMVLGSAVDMVTHNIQFFRSFHGFQLQQDLTASFAMSLLIFSLVYLCIALMGGMFTFFMRQTIIVMSRLIEFDLKNEIYQHYQLLDTAFYKRNNTGDLMSRITEDVSRVRMYLGPAVMYGINVFFLFSFVIFMMIKINAALTFWVLLPMPFLAISIYYVNGLINKGSERIQSKLSDLTTDAQEFYSGIRVLKTYVQENLALTYYERESEDYKQKSLALARIEAFFFPLMILLIGLSTILVVYVGGIEVIRGSITPGNIVEFIIYVNMLTWPVTSIGWVASIIQRAAASQKRINHFLKTTSPIINKQTPIPALKGKIEFKKVDFTYPDTGINALKNISFTILPGEKWAIVGRTGSGKSSIANLLFRLYDTTKGTILVDDVPVTKVDLYQLRKQMGYVPQDVFLFSDTIKNNINFSNDQLDMTAVQRAAVQASVHEEIDSFPEKYDTVVGERGVTLSGGQKQRISIARALIKQANVLVLDDSLSAIDANTEETILQGLQRAIAQKTVIVITHRIFSLLTFDKILVLDDGQIAEVGTHEELIKNQSIYYDLYTKQQLENIR